MTAYSNNKSFQNLGFKLLIFMESRSQLQIVHIYGINRSGEEERWASGFKERLLGIDNRKLLWHGSPIGNFESILTQGLRIVPKRLPHIYFSDAVGKRYIRLF